MKLWRMVGLCLMTAAACPAVLIPFLNRTDFANSTTLAAGLPNANGVDFTSAAVCPTTAVSGTVGCPTGSITYSSTGTGATPAVLSFAGIPNFSINGFASSLSSNAQRLALYAVSFDHASWNPMTYPVPVLSTRNMSDSNVGAVRIRLNLPSNVDSFAIDLSNGCNTQTNTAGNNCTPEENHLGTILVTAKRVGIAATETALVTTTNPTANADLTFFGIRSDAGDLEYVELTLPAFADAPTNSVANFGSIIATRIAFGEATPEPATLFLTAAGLALLLRRKLR